jgi:hypothetical protein
MRDSSTGSLEKALIQLQYALGDYYSRGKPDHRAAEFSPLDASLCVLREACVAAQISLFGAGSGPKDYRDKSALVDQSIPWHVSNRWKLEKIIGGNIH